MNRGEIYELVDLVMIGMIVFYPFILVRHCYADC
jgi:hypothetical protein